MGKKQPPQKRPRTKWHLLDAEGKRLARKGERLYDTKLKSVLEPAHKGKFVAIEVDSGDYFLGESLIDALGKAESKHPEKQFYFARVGFRAAISVRHRTRL
jgi:hypothetical protein